MTSSAPSIATRPRASHDDRAIAEVVAAAFGGDEEAKLIERLRQDGEMLCEWVATTDDCRLVGHIAFSTLVARHGSQSLRAAALAPLAVAPAVQRRGIGDRLTRDGLEALRHQGIELVVVLGHPSYYPRFGFSALRAKLLEAPYCGDSFMALELTPRALAGVTWSVLYPRAFSV